MKFNGKIAFDIDDTIIDLSTPVLNYIEKIYGIRVEKEVWLQCRSIEEVTKLKYGDALKCVNLATANLEAQKEIEGAIDFIRKYHKYTKEEIVFVTRRWDYDNTFKLLNILLNGIPYKVIFVKYEKLSALLENEVKYFIDDSPHVAKELSDGSQAGIKMFLFDQFDVFSNMKFNNNIKRVTSWKEIKNAFHE